MAEPGWVGTQKGWGDADKQELVVMPPPTVAPWEGASFFGAPRDGSFLTVVGNFLAVPQPLSWGWGAGWCPGGGRQAYGLHAFGDVTIQITYQGPDTCGFEERM